MFDMGNKMRGILIIGVIAVIVIVIIIVANRGSKTSPINSSVVELYAIRSGNGYRLNWDVVPSAKSYNLYIFNTAFDSLDVISRDLAIYSTQNIQSPFLLNDDVLNELKSNSLYYLSVTSVNNKGVESDFRLVGVERPNISHLEAPILHCNLSYSTITPPSEEDIEMCFQKLADDRFYLQWHPVPGAKGYRVYSNSNMSVSTASYIETFELPRTAYFLLTEPYSTSTCFSFIVTAIDEFGRESMPSQMFTNCPPI
jgi:hypothetical protein